MPVTGHVRIEVTYNLEPAEQFRYRGNVESAVRKPPERLAVIDKVFAQWDEDGNPQFTLSGFVVRADTTVGSQRAHFKIDHGRLPPRILDPIFRCLDGLVEKVGAFNDPEADDEADTEYTAEQAARLNAEFSGGRR